MTDTAQTDKHEKFQNFTDVEYIEKLEYILNKGVTKGDRTGTGTLSTFGIQMRFDLNQGFPILTTKSVHWHSVVHELLWFLRGDTNVKYLQDNKVRIWNEWATAEGEIGSMYGKQWREWDCYTTDQQGREFCFSKIDQIQELVNTLKNNPDSRRMLVNAWNVADLPDSNNSPQNNVDDGLMALAPCHYAFQCYVADGKLSMLVNQRSADFFLGVPFNISSYALLTHMLAQVTGLGVGELVWSGGDCHLYSNHIEQAKEQLSRFNKGLMYQPPKLVLNSDITNIDDFGFDDIQLQGYEHEPTIKAPIAV